MGELEDDKREIMDAVKNAIAAALNQHTLACPMAMAIKEHERIKIDLYNGEDGKSGLVAEFRDFISSWHQRIKDEDEEQIRLKEERARLAERDKDRRRLSQFRIGILSVIVIGILGWLGNKAWDQIQILTRLENDWLLYYNHPPAVPPIPQQVPQPQPKVQHKSYFEHILPGVSSNRGNDSSTAYEHISQ